MPDKSIPDLILASGSPRRKELLEANGYSFSVIVPDESVEASVSSDLPPSEFVAAASFAKAQAILALVDRGVIIAADTVAVCGGQIIGKPRNRSHARDILNTLRGRDHQVLTGVTLWDKTSNRNITVVERTDLVMEAIAPADLEAYLETNQWQGKAGAFGYQDGLDWVRISQGLESNVVGLPIELIPDLLKKLLSG